MSKEKNTVSVRLYDSTFADRPNERFGRIMTTKSLREDDLINIAVNRRTDLNAATLRAALNILTEIAIKEIVNGASVQFGPGFFSLDVKGAFTGDYPQWDPTVNNLRLKATARKKLLTAIRDIHVNIHGKASPGTVISMLTDVSSGEENKRLTPGGGVELTGKRIKIAGDDPENGIRLHNQASHVEYPVMKESILLNHPKKVSFIVPSQLPAGDYTLSLTTQYTTSTSLLKEPHTYPFEYILVVE
jgi:hypothetical protein